SRPLSISKAEAASPRAEKASALSPHGAVDASAIARRLPSRRSPAARRIPRRDLLAPLPASAGRPASSSGCDDDRIGACRLRFDPGDVSLAEEGDHDGEGGEGDDRAGAECPVEADDQVVSRGAAGCGRFAGGEGGEDGQAEGAADLLGGVEEAG